MDQILLLVGLLFVCLFVCLFTHLGPDGTHLSPDGTILEQNTQARLLKPT